MTAIEEVLQAHQTIFAAHNTGNAQTMANLFHPQFTLFHAEAGLRYDNFDLTMLQALNDAGYKGQVDSRYLDVKVFDNCAVVTGYLSGMFTWAGVAVQSMAHGVTQAYGARRVKPGNMFMPIFHCWRQGIVPHNVDIHLFERRCSMRPRL